MPSRNPMPPGRWDEVMERDRWCQATAYGFPTETPCQGKLIVHHRRVKGMGGTADPSIHDAENLVVLCGGVTGSEGHHGEVHANRGGASYDCGLLLRHNT